MKKKLMELVTVAAGLALLGTATLTYASDHDDGETDSKARALNLTDHFAFKSGSSLTLTMYFNPRSLPDINYNLSTNARYEFHVSKVATKTTAPTTTDDYLFRFEGGAPTATGAQPITLTVFKNGTSLGTNAGMSTDFATSKTNTAVVVNSGTVGGIDVKWFSGMRSDAFTFDVQRFFEVRSFLASRFFGGPNGTGNPAALGQLPPTCAGQTFAQGVLGTGDTTDGDAINLWNPPSCAPDFTKNYNVNAIVLEIPLAQLDGTIFDTWSSISALQ